MEDFEEILNNIFPIKRIEGKNKIIDLPQAIRENVRPGQKLHFSFTHSRPHAAAFELARQFWGKEPEFTLIATGVLEYGIVLVFGRLIKKMVASFYGDIYPSPKPNAIIQEAIGNKKLELENWTNLTMTMRLMAGALSIDYLTTRSIMGSTMEQENQSALKVIEDPLDPTQKIALMKSINPDIAFVHGWAADQYGNTIILPPYGENVWGAWASLKGVIVTVEKIVSTEFIREYSHFVKIPGHIVNTVSEVPFGAHPQGMSNQGVAKFEAYGEDYEFRKNFREAAKDPEQFKKWVDEWILGCQNHADYLKKIGSRRLLHLRGKIAEDTWKYELNEKANKISISPQYNPEELMVIVTARVIAEKVKQIKINTILAGIGNSTLAAWLAYYQLKSEGFDLDLLAETGFYGYCPRPLDPFIFNYSNIPTNKMQSNFIDILAFMAGGVNNKCLGVLAAGQIDRAGNLNSTRLSNGMYLTGSGGAADVANGAKEIIVVLKQSKTRFLERVPYVTAPGKKIRTLISDLGVYEKIGIDDEELTLTRCLPDNRVRSLEDKVKLAKENCGWELKCAETMTEVLPPSLKELRILRLFDPEGYYIGKSN